MKRKFYIILSVASIVLIFTLIVLSCGSTKLLRTASKPEPSISVDPKVKYLKVHMRDGGLYVLGEWDSETYPGLITGRGNYYDAYRNLIVECFQYNDKTYRPTDTIFRIQREEIALVETNVFKNARGNISSISVVGVPFALITAYCLANPKACFGSCPTFYANNGEEMELMAEGFSSSILPVFERKDIDKLSWAKYEGNEVSIKLTNEALETHVIRYVDLLALPVKTGQDIFATEEGKFYATSRPKPPVKCIANEGSCIELISQLDHQERFTEADSENLAEREYIEVVFNEEENENLGLIIASRQTLLTTFLFYQSMAYAGSKAGYYAARVESGDVKMKKYIQRMWDQLGGIEIFMKNDHGKWIKIDELEEMGPIASDVHIIKLPEIKKRKKKFKLRLTKGLWRIDYIALTRIEKEVSPIRLKPDIVYEKDGHSEHTKNLLLDTISPLVTLPGDQFDLVYQLPDEASHFKLFLETKGYYLEWMRDVWLEEEDQKKAAMMFTMPELYMRIMAPEFKKVEPTMEKDFWGSRYVKN